MSIALYAGSFDPPTNGHKWVIEKMSKNYEKGIIAIGINPDKKERFPFSDRLAMLDEIVKPFNNIDIVSFAGLYTADFADMCGATHLIRGIRNPNDLLYENDIRYINECINPNVETIFYTPPKELLQISSTMVIGLMGCLGWEQEVKDMVPGVVMEYLTSRQCKIDREYFRNRFKKERNIEVIIDSYCKKGRYYHNLSHIKNCLYEFDKIKDRLDRPEIVELALLSHDVVYNTKETENEIESANFAAIEILNSPILSRLIIVTDHKTPTKCNDEEYMVDIDLACFGYSWRIFDNNNKLIRKEYSHVSSKDYNNGRSAILRNFLNRDRIYLTKEFHDLYERKARKNIVKAIDELG